MTNIQRICEQCGESGPLNVRYCPHCGFDTQATLPTTSRNLPMVVGKAALPILVGAASLALRAGWKLLQDRLLTDAALSSAPQTSSHPTQSRPTSTPPVSARSKRKIHIRSSWTVGDANGNWRQGSSEHTIEFED